MFLALFWRRLDGWSTLAGWLTGTALGTFLLIKVGFASSSYDFGFGSHHTKLFIGVPALAVNVAVVLIGTVLARAFAPAEVPEHAPQTSLG